MFYSMVPHLVAGFYSNTVSKITPTVKYPRKAGSGPPSPRAGWTKT